MSDLNYARTPTGLFNFPRELLDKAVLNTVYMLRDEPQDIPDVLTALGLFEHAMEMVA